MRQAPVSLLTHDTHRGAQPGTTRLQTAELLHVLTDRGGKGGSKEIRECACSNSDSTQLCEQG